MAAARSETAGRVGDTEAIPRCLLTVTRLSVTFLTLSRPFPRYRGPPGTLESTACTLECLRNWGSPPRTCSAPVIDHHEQARADQAHPYRLTTLSRPATVDRAVPKRTNCLRSPGTCDTAAAAHRPPTNAMSAENHR